MVEPRSNAGIEGNLRWWKEQLENLDAINITVVDIVSDGDNRAIQLEVSWERDGEILGSEPVPGWIIKGDTVRLHLPIQVTLD